MVAIIPAEKTASIISEKVSACKSFPRKECNTHQKNNTSNNITKDKANFLKNKPGYLLYYLLISDLNFKKFHSFSKLLYRIIETTTIKGLTGKS